MRLSCALLAAVALHGETAPERLLAGVTASAETFRSEARRLLATETLAQRCYRIPEHGHFAIGKAAGPQFAQIVLHEITSEYRVAALRSDPSGNLVEIRAVTKKDGAPVRTAAEADKALAMDGSEKQIQKKLLSAFTDLGLLDVATNYGLILLAFTKEGMPQLEVKPVGPRYFGAEDAFVFRWRQLSGGLLELREKKPVRHPMDGELWVRLSDGMPLRITAHAEMPEPNHRIREDATVEFRRSPGGTVTPLLAIHRHSVDEQVLTENFFTYEPFRRFQVDTDIRYSGPVQK